ncbi:MAG: hypothetical protein [phage Lak_Megaphage_RVC_AP4_GC26]|uniref:Tail fiber protein n=1 Tax=phage Lak_Megaphage_RVC_AP3_GC26 TaxID=3109225 RepID=A0ABZ0YZA9_9CAUD|nr:MAG: hypothetical protein [phage Lak_Megaphage_RVC_AP3_GC26]WQJ52221.1 MAG: hypothetical protein [phage Lak_Megaphage_RVC_AP4_GC26]
MEYKSPLLNQIISILDKRSEAGEKRIKKTEDYVKSYDTSITRHINKQVELLNTSIKTATDKVIGDLNTSINNTVDTISHDILSVSTNLKTAIEQIYYNINTSINSYKTDTSIYLIGLKSELERKINDVDQNYKIADSQLSSTLSQNIKDVSTKLTQKVNTIDTKYDASISNLSQKHDSSFIQLTNLISSQRTSIDNKIIREISSAKQELNSNISTIQNNLNYKIDNINTSINLQFDRVAGKLEHQNTSIDDISIRLNKTAKAIVKALNASANDLYNITADISTRLKSSIEDVETDITEKYDAEIRKLNTSIINLEIDTTNSLNTLNTSVTTLETNQEKLNTSLASLRESFDKLVDTEDINGVIDTFKEVEDFLSNISDEKTLTGMLNELQVGINSHIDASIKDISNAIDNVKEEIGTNINNRINALETTINTTVNTKLTEINSSINDISTRLKQSITDQQTYVSTEIGRINSSIQDLNTTIKQNVDTSLKAIQSKLDSSLKVVSDSLTSTTSRVAQLELNNVTAAKVTTGTDTKLWNDTTDSINENSYVINKQVLTTKENNVEKTYEQKLVNSNIIKEINKSEKAVASNLLTVNNNIASINTKLSNINSSIDNILNSSYINKKNKYTTNGFSTIGGCLDFIINDLYYTAPAAVNVTYTVTPTSFIRGKNTSVTFEYTVNNYPNNIQSITYNDTSKTERTFTETITVSNSVSRALSVVSNYVDSKDARPTSFNKTLTAYANLELYVWTSTSTSFNNAYTSANMPAGYTTYTYNSGNYSINVNNGTTAKYIFFVSDKNLVEPKFFVYEHGGAPTLGGGITNLGTITIQKYDVAQTYYLYRTNNVLNGNWDIKF